MGWESFHSIWDEPVDPPLGGEEKKGKKKKKTSWWDDLHGSSTLDDYYGDLDLDGYSSKTAFDDSDSAWYRQNSFKYKRYKDYSPSQLFRSSIGFKSAYGGDNDAKNKAIRALRTLTRNANTIVDAANKISYTVQFSRGVDSNTGTMNLAGGKNQTVYVSADELIETKTAEEEDAVIDALTGFALLRVQISQTVAESVISEINAVSAAAMTKITASSVYKAAKLPDTPESIAKNLAAEFIDNYMAGTLAKSMLTRLCRRAVVTDWGGFAPYFVRHAKKFSGLSEKLAAAEPSVENYAAKISYNMIADEDEIKLDDDVAKIVERHLGNELEHAQILPACVALVADLRNYLTTALPNAAGELENTLAEGLESIIERQKEAGAAMAAKEQAAGEQMEKFADFIDELFAQQAAAEGTFNQAASAASRPALELEQLKFTENLVRALEQLQSEYETATKQALPELVTQHTDRRLQQNISHFYEQINYLEKCGVSAEKLSEKTHAEKTGLDKLEAKIESLKEFIQEAKAALRDKFKEIKEKSAQEIRDALTALPEWEKTITNLIEKVEQLKEGFKEKAAVTENTLARPLEALDTATTTLAQKAGNIEDVRELLRKLRSSRTAANGARSAANLLHRLLRDDNLTNLSCVMENMQSAAHGSATRNFLYAGNVGNEEFRDAVGTETELAQNHWHERAVEEFVAKKQLTKNTFEAVAMSRTNQELFDLFAEQFREREMEFPNSEHDFKKLGDDMQQQLEGAANGLGLSVAEMLRMIKQARDAEDSAIYDTTNAQNLGDLIREKVLNQLGAMSAVDEQLFGQAVPKKSGILDLSAVSQVNDEASNAVEEEYVAYIGGAANDAKPKLRVLPTTKHPHHKHISQAIVNANRGAIDRIKNALCFQGTKRTGEVHGLVSGDLDEGSLHKLRYDCEHIWSQKQIARLPDVAVGILVDQSGSMAGQKIEQAREMCIILAEAVRKIEGMHLHVYGHSANMQGSFDLTMFEHYSSYNAADQADLSGLGAIQAFSNNYDGYAIKEAAKMLAKDPAKRKYLFVISDGLPHGNGYSGDEARKHVTSVCSFVRNRLKIPTYAFAVGVHSSERAYFEEQYDKNKIVFLSTVKKCLPQIVRFLHSTLQREKTLVSADVD